MNQEKLLRECIQKAVEKVFAENKKDLSFVPEKRQKTLKESLVNDAEKVITENLEKDKVKETFIPMDKEHLKENKQKLHEELMNKWGFKKGSK